MSFWEWVFNEASISNEDFIPVIGVAPIQHNLCIVRGCTFHEEIITEKRVLDKRLFHAVYVSPYVEVLDITIEDSHQKNPDFSDPAGLDGYSKLDYNVYDKGQLSIYSVVTNKLLLSLTLVNNMLRLDEGKITIHIPANTELSFTEAKYQLDLRVDNESEDTYEVDRVLIGKILVY